MATPVLTQSASGTNSTVVAALTTQPITITQAFANPNTAGNTILVSVTAAAPADGFVQTPVSVTDTQGNTYTQIGWIGGTIQNASAGLFMAVGVLAGANTVTFTCGIHNDNPVFAINYDLAIAVDEFSDLLSPTVEDSGIVQQSAGLADVHVTLTDSHANSIDSDLGAQSQTTMIVADLLTGGTDFFVAVVSPGSNNNNPTLAPAITGASVAYVLLNNPARSGAYRLAFFAAVVPAVVITPAWLVVNEPGSGFTDQTARLFYGEGAQHSFNLQSKQRGQASYTLRVAAGDAYTPVRGSPIFLYDQTSTGFTREFAGLIQDFTRRQIGNQGYFFWDVTAVSFESVFDTVYARPVQYIDQTCGFIVADLFGRFESGAAVTLGTIQDGATIPLFNAELGVKLSDLFSQLATTSQFTWNVNPVTLELFFGLPSAVAAPFELTPDKALWDSLSLKLNGADYRNRQAVKLSYDSFAHSAEFFVGAGQTDFTLMRAVQQVTNAWATLSTCNTAIGTFSGNPSPGDTITIGVATEVWIRLHLYAAGGTLVVDGFVQKVTTPGTSGGTIPAFSHVTGQTSPNDGTVIWTCQGPAGLSTGTDTYTFVSTVDNTVFGDVLIGATATDTCLHLVDAINANAITRGITFSLPTWECSLCNAILNTGTGFTIQRKNAGSGWIAALSETSGVFSWSSAVTTGGTSPQGSLGPGEGATIVLQVYVRGTSTASPALYYTPGDTIVHLASPLNVGSNLNVEYTRADGNVIEVEDTALVNALAAITHGTGKYQQMVDQSTTGVIATSSAAGLQFAQQALAAYKVPPVELEAQLYIPGLLPGQEFVVNLTGPLAIFNNTYFIEEIQAELVPVYPYLDSVTIPGAGHYRYTLHLIDIAQIGSYMDFWEGLGGGGSGGGQGSALVATSGGGLAPSPLTFPLDFTGQTLSTTIAAGSGFAYDLASFLNAALNGCTFTGRFAGAIFQSCSISGGTFDGCDFSGCDFSSCVFSASASFIGCNFTGANFTDAHFTSCDFSLSEFIGANFGGQSGSAALIVGCDFHGSNFTGCDFSNAVIHSTASNFQDATFAAAQMLYAVINGADFRGANFAGASFIFADLTGCNCSGVPGTTDTLFRDAFFQGVALEGVDFSGCDLSGSRFLNCYDEGTNALFAGANLTGALFNFIASPSGGTDYGGPTGAVDLRAGSYAALPWDCNKLEAFSAAATLTLPATAPSDTWEISAQNYSAGVVVIGRNGLNIDGAAANVSLAAGTGLRIFSDGTNYFTERGGGGGGGTVSSFADNETPSGTVNGSNAAFTLAHTPNPAGSLQLYVNGVLQIAGTDYTLATATITFGSAPSTGALLTAFYRY